MTDISIKKVAVLTSGGDSPGMNAAIRAVVRTAAHYNIECCGVREGYNGLINNAFIKMNVRSVRNIINQGGTILKSARSTEFRTKEGRAKAYQNIKDNEIDALVCIGGDGTFTGAKVFSEEHPDIRTIGIPGTIDNDIFGTDNTIGFDTALNTAMEAIDKIRDTATSHNRIFFVEVMGRDAGFIALHSGIASGALEILIPEQKDSMSDLFDSFRKSGSAGRTSSIVVVAEGEELGGIYTLAKETKKEFPEFDIRVAVLGHIQRGGSPSCADRVLASRLGYGAVVGLLEGKNKVMVGLLSSELRYTPIEDAIKKHREIDKELIKISEILAI